jgi:iron(III) transport system substrate-binding protein
MLPLVLLTAVLFCTDVEAADPALVGAAEKEGKLTLYACDVGETPPQIKNFEKLYPKIRVSSYVAGCWQTYNRNANESSSGRPIADLMQATQDVLTKLDDDNALADYSPPALEAFPSDAKPQGDKYILYKRIIAGFGYNADVVKGIATPADWTDFAVNHPEWKDKISFYDPRTSSVAFAVLATLYQDFGPDGAGKIYTGLRASGAELSATTPAGVAKMLSGEKPIMFYILSNQVGALIAKGTPLKFSIPASGAVGMGHGVGILKTATHINAAKLFVDYMLNEGQSIVAERGEYAMRIGITPPVGMPPLASIKIMPTDIRAALKQQKTLISSWQERTGIQ